MLVENGKVQKLAYSVEEAAKVLGVSRAQMYMIARTEGFPTVMVGRRILISVKGLEAWVEKQAETGWVPAEGEMKGREK